MTDIDEQMLEQLATRIVDEAMDAVREGLTADELATMRSRLFTSLMCTPEGRRHLRRCIADPKVDRSGQRSNTAEPSPKEREGS